MDPAGHDQNAEFPSTRWTEVELAARSEVEGASEALENLLRAYRPPLVQWLQRFLAGRGLSPQDAEDIFGDFYLNKIERNKLLLKARRERGPFRHFLRTALGNFARDRGKNDRCQKRRPPGGLCSLDDPEMPVPSPAVSPEDDFTVAFVRGVLAGTLERMQVACERLGQPYLVSLFRARELDPILQGTEPVPHARLAEEFSLSDANASAKALMKATEIYRECLLKELGRFPGAKPLEELRDLQQQLSGITRAGSRISL